MGPNLIALSIPVLFAMLGVELLASRLLKRDVYRFHDAIADLSCGVGSEATGVAVKAALFAAYIAVYNATGLFEMAADSWVTWLVATIGFDFAYYWWHRLGHRVNFLWAMHAVHHQSEDYNLAVALRQAWFTRLTSWILPLGLAIIGVPPLVFGASAALNTLYQFWIHTRLLPKLGPLEWVLNTPSHHRVHHAINPKYIDKNYAGFLIIWDRMFGTYAVEEEEPTYGMVRRFTSWNAAWAQFEPWVYLAGLAAQARGLSAKLKVWFGPPEWHPVEGVKAIPDVDAESYEKFETPSEPRVNAYVFIQFLVATAGLVWLLFIEPSAGTLELYVLAALVVWTTATWPGFFARRGWAFPLEALRLVALPALALGFSPLLAPRSDAVLLGAMGLSVASGALLWWAVRNRGSAASAPPGAQAAV